MSESFLPSADNAGEATTGKVPNASIGGRLGWAVWAIAAAVATASTAAMPMENFILPPHFDRDRLVA
jgi:hypothetical protein